MKSHRYDIKHLLMETGSSKRLLSLDVFRGLTIAGMILVNSPGNNTAYRPLDHAEWNGMTPTDLVFPFFIFIVGVSLVFSLRKRLEDGATRRELFAQVLKRTAILFALGLFLNGYPYLHLSSIRILGVLQRIALCYFFASMIFLWGSVSTQIMAFVAILLGYWGFMTLYPVPGFGPGNLTKEGNLASFIDRAILAGHLYRPVYDPEGILSTLPAIATALSGVLAGMWLRFVNVQVRKVTGLLQAGLVCLLAGWKWGYYFPINKALWTSSYVLISTGWALVILSLCYWLIEVRGWKHWSKPFEIFGTNAVAAYFLHVFFLKIQNQIHLPRLDGSPGNLRLFLTDHLFGTWLTPQDASLAYAICYTLLWLFICWNFYRRKLFLKI
jgi:predicted acyltransferase